MRTAGKAVRRGLEFRSPENNQVRRDPHWRPTCGAEGVCDALPLLPLPVHPLQHRRRRKKGAAVRQVRVLCR